jgi:hypothetical protein
MAISSVLGARPILPVQPVPVGSEGPEVDAQQSGLPVAAEKRNATQDEGHSSGEERPGRVDAHVGLELRIQTLPNDSSTTLVQMVDPRTGQVVREFPPEELAQALAEIRKHATAHLDRTA